jgi:hypothetical protein
MPHFQAILKSSSPTTEAYQAARLYQIAAWVHSGDKKQRMQALKAARQLSTEATGNPPGSDAETLLHWEGRTMLLRMLVLQPTPPAGSAINMAAGNCQAAEGTPLKLVQDCLVAAIRTRSLAESGRPTTAAEQLPKAEQFFVRHGVVATLVGRLIPAVRQLISIPAGLVRMNLAKFALYTAIGAGIWNGVLAAMGYFLESAVPEDQLISTVTKYSHEIGYGILAVVVIALGIIIYKGVKKR